MELIKKTVNEIAKHAIAVVNGINESKVADMMETVLNADSVFIVGTGRSELVGKAFAMRLMHLGFNVYVVGEVTTPAIKEQDCLIAISGSGETKTVIIAAKTAKDIRASVIGITGTPKSTLRKYLDIVIDMDSKTKEPVTYYTSHVLKGEYDDLTPLGTLFEDSSHLFFEGLIAEFMTLLGKREIDLKERHAIIEK
jgi:6-phospho-3-hexuloisomerase